MEPATNPARLKLTFAGPVFIDGAVPVTVLAAKLQALQALMFHAAAAVRRDPSARRGQWVNRHRNVAELTLINTHHSDLVVELSVPSPPALGEDFDDAAGTVDLVFDVGAAIFDGRTDKSPVLEDLRADDREYLLRAFDNLIPNRYDNFTISLENCKPDKHSPLLFTANSKQMVRKELKRLDRQLEPQDEVVLVGELTKIHVDTSPTKITIRVDRREIDCYYPESLRDQVANLLAGSLVEVTGFGVYSANDALEKIDRTTDVITVSTEPIRMVRFEHEGAIFQLSRPVVLDVKHCDGLWSYSNEDFNLWGRGVRRDDAIADLSENFAYLWQEIAEANDDELDGVALRLKGQLRALASKILVP